MVAISFSRSSSWPRNWTHVSYHQHNQGSPLRCSVNYTKWGYMKSYLAINVFDLCVHAKSFQSCPTVCNPMDCSPPGSSVHGIFLARILEWVAISSSRRSSPPRDQTWVSSLLHWQADSLPMSHLGLLIIQTYLDLLAFIIPVVVQSSPFFAFISVQINIIFYFRNLLGR